MSSDTAIAVENLSKTYLMYRRPQDRLKQFFVRSRKAYYTPAEALKPVSFSVRRGESVAIMGRNGSGKSTLLQLICGTLNASSGEVKTSGRISALLELGAGFNPEFTGRENLFLNASILGLSPKKIEEKYDAIVAFSGIGEKIHQPVKTYSSGMVVRLAFAIAIATDPEILVVDEALAVGDEAFQRKCFSRIRELQKKGMTLLFVSHSVNNVIELCDRAILMDEGEMLADGDPKSVIAHYHKLLYGPPEKQAEIRAALKAGLKDAPRKEQAGAHPTPQFDPAMKPESTVIYETHGAHISNIRITTPEGEPVNLLVRQQRYLYSFDVRFDSVAEGVRFGMNIKTATGAPIAGATSHTDNALIDKVQGGTTCRVSFSFKCLLLPGTYFTNAGCTGLKDAERITLHRIVDAAMFKVLPEGQLLARGIADLMIEPQVSVL